MMKTYSFLGAITLAAFSFACSDDGDGEEVIVNGTGAGGTAPVGGVGGGDVAGDGDAVTGGTIFSGGTWVEAADNTVGIQGSFFVLEDSMKDGVLVVDSLQHTDLIPDEFNDDTVMPCVTGTVAAVTASDGVTECGFGAGDEDCDWDTWGGGIGFNLNETGGEESVQAAFDATGITGFTFNISDGGFTGDIRFKATMEGSDQDFCANITDGDNSVDLVDLLHECWDPQGTETLDTTKLMQLQWQLVTAQGTAYEVADFCVNSLSFY